MERQGGDALGAMTYFVRVTGRRRAFVTFELAIGSPDLSVELMMPDAQFEEFRRRYGAIDLTSVDADGCERGDRS
ncbi:MAG: hypothetical protein F8N37_20265 [Telmatospirillum sp.]|nr:hypothetical protein [Telmatospirillum sp.]